LVVAIRVGADVDAGNELQPVEIGKARDATRGLCRLALVLVGKATGGVEHAADQAAPHIGPFRTLGAVEPDQREDLAAGVLTFEHGELAIEIDRAGRAARGVAAGPTL